MNEQRLEQSIHEQEPVWSEINKSECDNASLLDMSSWAEWN